MVLLVHRIVVVKVQENNLNRSNIICLKVQVCVDMVVV